MSFETKWCGQRSERVWLSFVDLILDRYGDTLLAAGESRKTE